MTDVINGKNVLGDYGVKVGVDFRWSTPMVRLLQDESGKVTGAIAQKGDGSYLQVNASKGVVVCTGGYARNDDMMAALQPQTLDKYSLSIAIAGTEGDGIKACLWAGAHMDEVHTAMVFDRVAVKPDEIGGSQTTGSLFWMGSQPLAQGEPQRRALHQRERALRLHPQRRPHPARPHHRGHLGL